MSAPTVTLYVQVPDAVVQSHGLIVAAVYGCIRRYIMFGGGHKCHHTLDEIANTLNLNKKTAQRAIDRLEGDGLIATERPKGRVMTIRLAGAIQFAERADVGRMTLDTESTPTQDFKSTPAANPGLRVHTTPDTESTPFLIGEIKKEQEGVLSHTAPADEPDAIATFDQSAFAASRSGHAVTVAQSAQSSPPTPPADAPRVTTLDDVEAGTSPETASKWVPFFTAVALDMTGRANAWRDTRPKAPKPHKALYGRLAGIFGGACNDDVDAAIALWHVFVGEKKTKTFRDSGEPLWRGVTARNAGDIAEKWVLDRGPTIAPSTGRRVVDAWTGR